MSTGGQREEINTDTHGQQDFGSLTLYEERKLCAGRETGGNGSNGCYMNTTYHNNVLYKST